ncbi:MAG: TonB-dependent receptor [Pseudomonadaceae bacterium]|nr:TonB-dependent receptor [Pseudomonadaceae bacterium]
MNLGKALIARIILFLGLGLIIHPAVAQDAAAEEVAIEEVVVTGVRGKPRTVMDSAVPIDVFGQEEIESVSHSDTHDILQTLVPSYNVGRQPISDGSTFIRPGSLRGLPSDKTLVLVNSKRRHRASLVSIGGSGTQGPDVATIPAVAIKTIEVLRDGAAAQYGSDAIAGVINFILKDNNEGFSFTIDTGEYFEGDGLQTTIQANAGFKLGERGFLSISGEYADAEFSERAEQYCESWFCLNPNNARYDPTADYVAFTEDPTFLAGVPQASLEGDVVQPWGQPNSEALRFFYNAGYELGDGAAELYSFGSYSASEGDGGFFYRYPGNGTIEDLRLEDGSVYSPLEIFPGGFTPRFEGEVEDYSFAAGIRGAFGDSAGYDASFRYGYNEISYTLNNTINPSLGPDTPTSFKPGDLSNEEIQFQIDVYQDFDLGLESPVTVALGVSYMDETYEVVQGQELSYIPGPFASQDPFGFCSDEADVTARSATAAGLAVIGNGSSLDCTSSSDPVYRVVGVGSNGFPGYSPEFSEEYTRDSYGVYVDVSADVTERLFLQSAIRYEDYSDFGSETVWKVAGRFSVTDNFAIRSSVGTGFRAPTPGQQGTTNVSTRLPNGFPVATGLFPASSNVAQALGASDLKAETSENFTLGFTADIGELGLTLDFYNIDIADRVYAVSTLDVSTDPTNGSAFDNYQALVGAGVAGAESIGGVFYFTNAFDSSTQGVDLVATYPLDFGEAGTTTLTASVNYNKSELDSDASAFLNGEDQFDFENRDPEIRGVFTAVHGVGPVSILGRMRYFGESEDADSSPTGSVQKFDALTFFDLEAAYQINENFRVTVGGRNIFDEYPDKVDRAVNGNDYCCGRVYASTSVADWQGGYYYLRLNADL